jgi:RND superfamily putative drug exporter
LITESLILPLKPVVILVLIFTPTDPNYESSLGIAPTGYMDGIFIFSVAFGLSVDYEICLLNRVLEEYGMFKDIVIALLNATQATGGIITFASVRKLFFHLLI